MGDQDVDAVEVQPHLNSFISLCAQPLMIYTQFCFFFLWYGRSRSKVRSLHVKKQFEIKSTLTPVVM